MPAPTLEEQQRIIGDLVGIRAKLDAVESLQAETSAELNAMLPAILDKAFNGEMKVT